MLHAKCMQCLYLLASTALLEELTLSGGTVLVAVLLLVPSKGYNKNTTNTRTYRVSLDTWTITLHYVIVMKMPRYLLDIEHKAWGREAPECWVVQIPQDIMALKCYRSKAVLRPNINCHFPLLLAMSKYCYICAIYTLLVGPMLLFRRDCGKSS